MEHQLNFFIYNLLIMFLILVHSLGYFHPYFEISANVIIVPAIILGIILIGIRSRHIFFLSTFFWVVAWSFQSLNIEVWAERVSIYTFESLVIGSVMLVYEESGEKTLEFLKALFLKKKKNR